MQHLPPAVFTSGDDASSEPIELEVVIEVPRGSFLKRASTGSIDFVSPLPLAAPARPQRLPGLVRREAGARPRTAVDR